MPGSGLAAPRTAATKHKFRTFKGVRGGGGMDMLAGLPAAVGSVVNPAVVKASSRAVGELLCCCGLGVMAAKKGILTPVNVAALSKVCACRPLGRVLIFVLGFENHVDVFRRCRYVTREQGGRCSRPHDRPYVLHGVRCPALVGCSMGRR